jgi:hypothetical protein
LERIDGLEVRQVDLVVPGGIPFGFESTYTRDLKLEKGALYSMTIWDANQNEMGKGTFVTSEAPIENKPSMFFQLLNLFHCTLYSRVFIGE